MEKMHAVVVHAPGDFTYEEVERPHADPGEVVLRVGAAGICAGDRKIFQAHIPWKLNYPYRIGHEYVGTVVELGQGADERTGLGLGDHATAEIFAPCRQCYFCHRGWYHLCEAPGRVFGGWAEYIKLPANAIVWKVPNDLPMDEAVLTEPLACAIHGVQLAKIGLADVVVISGLGAIGMGMLQAARLQTPRRLIALDIDENLCALALQLGADEAINPAAVDIEQAIRARTDGRGADIFIEASGSVAALQNGFRILRKRGRMVVFGVYDREAQLDFNQVGEFKELEIIGGHLSPNTFPLAIKYLTEKRVNAHAMVTHRFPLKDFATAIQIKSKEASIKTILIP